MHILVAVDRSTESQNALVNALDVVNALDGQVTAIHVVPDEDAASESPPSKADASEKTALLERAVERAESRGMSIKTALLVGDPIEEIVEFAESSGADAIYVGHRGLASEDEELTGDRRGPLGSVSKGLVERTRVPVTVFDRGL